MRVAILGSAAAEGWPAPFCVCAACRQARELGGKDIRRRTSYQLGEYVHLDWGPDSYFSMISLGLDYAPLRHLLITHAHQDHWCPEELAWRRKGYSQIAPDSLLTVYGNEHVRQKLEDTFDDLATFSLCFYPVTPYEEIRLEDNISAIPLPATHSTDDEMAVNYLFQYDGLGVMIGNDTGWWMDEVWEFLTGRRLDVVIMDCTSGPLGPNAGEPNWPPKGHLNCAAVIATKDELARRGVLADGCRFIANHFSHNGGWLHEQLEAYFSPHGIETGYDGMVVNGE